MHCRRTPSGRHLGSFLKSSLFGGIITSTALKNSKHTSNLPASLAVLLFIVPYSEICTRRKSTLRPQDPLLPNKRIMRTNHYSHDVLKSARDNWVGLCLISLRLLPTKIHTRTIDFSTIPINRNYNVSLISPRRILLTSSFYIEGIFENEDGKMQSKVACVMDFKTRGQNHKFCTQYSLLIPLDVPLQVPPDSQHMYDTWVILRWSSLKESIHKNHHTGLPNSATSLVGNSVVDLGKPVYW